MRNFLIISAMLVLMSSCQDVQRTKRPDDLIPEEKMVEIITEVSLLQGARTYNRQILEQKGLNPKEYIWRRFDVDSSQFARSSNYYADNYEQYQRIYDSVKNRLEGMKQIYDSLRAEEERVTDSIRTADRATDSIRQRRDSMILIDGPVPLESIRNREDSLILTDSPRYREYSPILNNSILLLDSLRNGGEGLILADGIVPLESLRNRGYGAILIKSIVLLDSLRNSGGRLILTDSFVPLDTNPEGDISLPEPMSREDTIP